MLSHEKFLKIKDYYWVPAEPNSYASWHMWTFGLEEPPPVPNPRMHWRHPTFEEANTRQEVFETDPRHFFKLVRSGFRHA